MSLLPGIYIHWPFCARKCPYCDFYTFGAEHPQFGKADAYLRALIAEIESLPERWRIERKPEVDTIYFGGGTPSLIEPQQLEIILQAVRDNFCLVADAEITLEVNPTAAEAARLRPARELGVNRLSVGCQSFDDKFLKLLGRDHDAATARRVISEIQSLGFGNYSLDLMFSLPGQRQEDVQRDLEAALSFRPAHISVYGLTLHEGTPFKRWNEEGRWEMPESDLQAMQFEFLMERLALEGFEHYEISNWSLPGRASRHNAKYWSSADIFAFGVSAHGVRGGRRYHNPRDLKAYLNDDLPRNERWSVFEDAAETSRAKLGEIMMVALRRTKGVAWGELNTWADAWNPREAPHALQEFYAPELSQLADEGFVNNESERVSLTGRGIMFADEVVLRFF